MKDYSELDMMVNGRYRFAAREHQVTAMLAHGFGDKAIARHLGMTVKHVQSCMARAVRRNQLRNREELARVYQGFGDCYLQEVLM